MCRLVAYIGGPITLDRLVFGGAHSLYEQSWAPRELLSGAVNADGYGVAWFGEEGAARIAEARPIWHDAELSTTLGRIESGCAVAALRNSTPGIPVDRSGLLPLLRDGWAFVLNGFVPDFRRSHMRALRTTLPDELYAELEGSSDSETLFLLALAELRGGASPRAALEAVVRTVVDRVGEEEAQLNMVLSDGTSLVAVRAGTPLVTNSLYLASRPPFAPDGWVLASEAPDPGAVWEPVDGHAWIEVDADGSVRSEILTVG